MPTGRLTQLSHSPRVYVADDFLSEAEIAHVIAAASPERAAARGLPSKADATGFSFEMPVAGDAVLETIRARVHETLGIVNQHGQTFRFRHYRASEAHPPHLDCYEIAGSHLVATALMHLVDCPSGGATRFPRAWPAPLSIDARRGRLVSWFNYYPNGAQDQSSFHEGAAIAAGEKITITAFIYAPLADAARVPPGL